LSHIARFRRDARSPFGATGQISIRALNYSMLRLCLLHLLLLPVTRARVVVSVDLGTDSARADVFDAQGHMLASTEAGWTEQQPQDWWAGLGAAVRGALSEAGVSSSDIETLKLALPLRPGPTSSQGEAVKRLILPGSGREVFVEPSVLAADVGALSAAAREMSLAGATWTHVDVGDGSVQAGRQLTSLGPSSVAAIRAAAPNVKIDVHLYTLDPEAHIETLIKAGADRITFQIEHLEGSPDIERRAFELARAIHAAGALAGVCLAPHTPLSAIDSLVAAGLVDLVDVLAVLPGIGGQKFRPETLDKVRALRSAHPELPYLMVDGGVDASTCPLVAAAGANVVVSGSYLFGAAPGEMGARLAGLEAALLEHGD
jgi:ribulose-phosphate 3-epimerase